MRCMFAWLVALLVGLPALTPACAYPPRHEGHGVMHRTMPDCHHDADTVERCIGCGLAAVPASDALLDAPIPITAPAPVPAPPAIGAGIVLALRDPPPRFAG